MDGSDGNDYEDDDDDDDDTDNDDGDAAAGGDADDAGDDDHRDGVYAGGEMLMASMTAVAVCMLVVVLPVLPVMVWCW